MALGVPILKHFRVFKILLGSLCMNPFEIIEILKLRVIEKNN